MNISDNKRFARNEYVKYTFGENYARKRNKSSFTDKNCDYLKVNKLQDLREDRLEGKNPIMEALKAGRKIDKLWIKEGAQESDPQLSYIVRQVKKIGAVVIELDKHAMDSMAQTANCQSIIAQLAMKEYMDLDDLIKLSFEKSPQPILVMCDEIQDAYNLGSIFRCAEAANIQGLIISKRRQVQVDAVVAKCSAGASEHVPCAKVGNLSQAVAVLKEAGFWVADTKMDGENIYHNKAVESGPLLIVVGNEGKGVSPSLSANCDFHLSIPMLGKLNSLNVAVATGIVIFEILRKRRTTDV